MIVEELASSATVRVTVEFGRILVASHSCFASGGMFLQYQYSLKQRAALQRAFGDVRVGFTLANIPPAFVYECSPQGLDGTTAARDARGS